MIAQILKSALVLSIVDGGLSVKGPKSQLVELLPIVKQWKPELAKIAAGETVSSVGSCDHCNTDLLGLLVHGGYINRVCPTCGRFAICLPPGWTPEEVRELLNERQAIMEYSGGLSRAEADQEGLEAVRHQLEEQKTISKSADEVYKGGRQSGRTDDQVTQLFRS